MRRKDREITDIAQIVELMRRCRICNLALEDEDYPYVVPLNFGISVSGDSITIYFHGAKQGKKHDLIQKNNHVAFAMYNACEISLGPAGCACKSTIEYESVMGTGIIEYVEGAQKIPALDEIMRQYDPGQDNEYRYNQEAVNAISVLRLEVKSISGKRNFAAGQYD